MIGRRKFFGVLAAVAASPILAKLPIPAPVARSVKRMGAWAEVKMSGGMITAITITNGGFGYSQAPTVTFENGITRIEPPK